MTQGLWAGHKNTCLEACAKNCELTAPGTPDCPLGDPNCVPPGVSVHNYRVNSVQTNAPNQCLNECWMRCRGYTDDLCYRNCTLGCQVWGPGTPQPPLRPPSDPGDIRALGQSGNISPISQCYNTYYSQDDLRRCLSTQSSRPPFFQPPFSDVGNPGCPQGGRNINRQNPCQLACSGVVNEIDRDRCSMDCLHCETFYR